tara:strand:- start:179 stop:787 length:609 start_codon:yes stop_codon:yes gene_type:complete
MKSIDVLPIKIQQAHFNQNEILKFFIEDKINNWPLNRITDDIDFPKSLEFDIVDLPDEFYAFIEDSIEEFLFFQNIRYSKYFISLIWINIHSKKQNKHVFHVHKNSIFSGVYYYETLKNDSLTFFDLDYEFSKYYDFITNDNKDFGQRKTNVSVKEGDVLFFRSDIMHGVERFQLNKNERRISISFNINLEGIGSHKRKTFK